MTERGDIVSGAASSKYRGWWERVLGEELGTLATLGLSFTPTGMMKTADGRRVQVFELTLRKWLQLVLQDDTARSLGPDDEPLIRGVFAELGKLRRWPVPGAFLELLHEAVSGRDAEAEGERLMAQARERLNARQRQAIDERAYLAAGDEPPVPREGPPPPEKSPAEAAREQTRQERREFFRNRSRRVKRILRGPEPESDDTDGEVA